MIFQTDQSVSENVYLYQVYSSMRIKNLNGSLLRLFQVSLRICLPDEEESVLMYPSPSHWSRLSVLFNVSSEHAVGCFGAVPKVNERIGDDETVRDQIHGSRHDSSTFDISRYTRFLSRYSLLLISGVPFYLSKAFPNPSGSVRTGGKGGKVYEYVLI